MVSLVLSSAFFAPDLVFVRASSNELLVLPSAFFAPDLVLVRAFSSEVLVLSSAFFAPDFTEVRAVSAFSLAVSLSDLSSANDGREANRPARRMAFMR